MSELNTNYEPGIVPDNPEALQQFLYDELYRISNAILRFKLQLLYGAVPAFALNTTPVILTNYASGNADQANGQIIVPNDGAYIIRMWVSGAMTSPNNNNQYFLNLVVDGTPGLAAVNDVSHNSTDNIALSAVVTRYLTKGQVLEMQMQATASMGTCTLEGTTFELERIV